MGTWTQVPSELYRPLTWGDTNREGRQAKKRHHKAGREPGDRSHEGRRGWKGKVAYAEHSVARGKLLVAPPQGADSEGAVADGKEARER